MGLNLTGLHFDNFQQCPGDNMNLLILFQNKNFKHYTVVTHILSPFPYKLAQLLGQFISVQVKFFWWTKEIFWMSSSLCLMSYCWLLILGLLNSIDMDIYSILLLWLINVMHVFSYFFLVLWLFFNFMNLSWRKRNAGIKGKNSG